MTGKRAVRKTGAMLLMLCMLIGTAADAGEGLKEASPVWSSTEAETAETESIVQAWKDAEENTEVPETQWNEVEAEEENSETTWSEAEPEEENSEPQWSETETEENSEPQWSETEPEEENSEPQWSEAETEEENSEPQWSETETEENSETQWDDTEPEEESSETEWSDTEAQTENLTDGESKMDAAEWNETEWDDSMTEGMEREDTETETESETESELPEEDIELFAMNLTPSGSPLPGTAGWKKVVTGQRFSPEYYPVRFYSGISSMELFNHSSAVLHSFDQYHRLYPTKGGEGGKFGAIYRKVLYDGTRWYDLKMTVADYTTSVRCDGGTMMTAYPFVEFQTGKIAWNFNDSIGAFVLKCEFLEHDTGAAARVNTRFQWWDIDGAQRYGIRLLDGSVSGKYYYEGTPLYYQGNQTVAGIGGLDVVVGRQADAQYADATCCITYELSQCSSYYMSIGLRDHLEDDDYSMAKSTLTRLKEELASGTFSGNRAFLEETDTSMSIIDTPSPVKTVSNDGKTWTEHNTLPKMDGEYDYRLQQFVPWQNANAYYASLQIKDVLPPGVDYVGGAKIIREEDGKDVTGWFTVTSDGDVLLATAGSTARSSSDFYGYHYRLTFRVKMDTSEIKPDIKGDTATFQVTNTASVIVKHSSENNYVTKNSNSVQTDASAARNLPKAPIKGLDGDQNKTEKILVKKNDTIVYSIFQDIPVNDTYFLPRSIEMTDALEASLEYESASVKIKKAGAAQWENASGWSIQASGQNVTVSGPCDRAYQGGTVQFEITCHIRKNADLSPWRTIGGEKEEYRIPNKAAVTFSWDSALGSPVRKETNTVQVIWRETHIRLTKEIYVDEIVWAHGRPNFIFKVEGEDTAGEHHVYYQLVEFVGENIGEGGLTSLMADFTVPAGTYRATEEAVIRYNLEEIHSISNGTKEGDSVVFHLENGSDGAAVFRNRKTTDEDESHTASVINKIGNRS